MNLLRQLAQAVLGLGLLGHVGRLLLVAINDNRPPPASTASPLAPAPSTAEAQPPPAGSLDPGPPWIRDQRGGGVLPGGDVGGDAQLSESFSVRFHHRDQPGAMVTYRYYAAVDLDDLTTISVERQTELLACTDPADPGSTEQWSDYRYAAVQRGFGSVEAATAAARRAAEAHLACDEDWSGRPPWEAK